MPKIKTKTIRARGRPRKRPTDQTKDGSRYTHVVRISNQAYALLINEAARLQQEWETFVTPANALDRLLGLDDQ